MFVGSFLAFILFFVTAVSVVVLFLYLYAKITPYDDYDLILNKNNLAASIGFGGAVLGLSIPLYSALLSSVSYLDFLIWAVVAMSIQLSLAYALTRYSSRVSLRSQIQDDRVSAGILMAFVSVSVGLLNAGSMSY